MEPHEAKAKLEAAKEKYDREIRVFETSPACSSPNEGPKTEESDDFYEFTAEDYFRITSTKKEDKYLKTRRIRDAEEATRRSKITKAIIRTRFPDNHTLEATFHPSEKIQSLFDLLKKVIALPDSPFYLYTTPPKKIIKDVSQDFYTSGFVPGAILYFSYDALKGEEAGDTSSTPFLLDEVMSLKGLELLVEQPADDPAPKEPEAVAPPAPAPALEERKPADKKPVKPKWLKM